MRGFFPGVLLLAATLAANIAAAPATAPTPASAPAPPPEPMHFKTNGFSIAPLETHPGDTDYMALQMFMGPTGGFTPDVNVIVGRHVGTIDRYIDAAKRQLINAHFELVNISESKEDSGTIEYTGTMRAQKMHWYARATTWNGRVFLAVAAATESQWPSLSAPLRACIDSLVADKPGQDPPPGDRLHLRDSGFSINRMEEKAIPPQSTVVVMNLPGAGAKPQVNVLIQPYIGTMADYVEHTQKQFESMKYTMIEMARPGNDAVTFEFTGDLGGKHMHWYTRTVLSRHQLYVAAAAAGEDLWPNVWQRMRACVDSLEVDKTEPPAASQP